MKKLLPFLLLVTSGLFGQNGVTNYSMPSGYNKATLQRNCIAVDTLGNKWVGFRRIGAGRWYNGNWTLFKPSNSILPDSNIRAIGVNKATNDVWIGMNNGGAAKYDGSNWTVLNTGNSGLPTNTVYSIAVHNGVVWFGTTGGLVKYTGSGWTQYSTINSGIAGDTINEVAIDGNGIVWAGTTRGLSKFNGTTWTNFTAANSPALAMDGEFIRAVYVDSLNDVWFSSGTMFKMVNNVVTPLAVIYTAPGLTYPGSFSICRGPGGGACFFSNNKLFEVINNIPQIYYLNAWCGSSNECAYDPTDGALWFVKGPGALAPYYNLARFDSTSYSGPTLGGATYYNVRDLDVNDVRATIMNRGDMHWNLISAGYEVPKGSYKHSNFSSSLWIGGLDSIGTLHQAAMTYRQNGCDYWPGPLDTLSATTDTTTAVNYDFIWKLDRNQISDFIYNFSIGTVQNGSYIPPDDLVTWPAQGNGNYSRHLAPFVDVNGNGVYDPLVGGDYPIIKGDQMIYSIYNDNLTAHGESHAAPLKVEVHASAYAYVCPTPAPGDEIINYSTFYNFEVYNRSGSTYDSVYIGTYQDPDLGAWDDDMAGCYPQRNYAYVYNGDQDDGTSPVPALTTYGADPPMLSTVILNGPEAEPGDGIDNDNDGTVDEANEVNLLTDFMVFDYSQHSDTGMPYQSMDYYNYMRSIWPDSLPLTYGARGRTGVTPTRFMYPDWPSSVTGWNELLVNNTPYDRHYLMSSGPFKLSPNERVDYDYALVWTKDTSLAWNSPAFYSKNLTDVSQVKNWFINNNAPSCMQWVQSTPEMAQEAKKLSLYPNPSSELLTIRFDGERGASFDVMDLTGRRMQEGKLMSGGTTVINVGEFPAGIYFVRVIDGGKVYSSKFVRN